MTETSDSAKVPAKKKAVARRARGDGQIVDRGGNTYRLRYRVNGKRFSKTIQGTKADAVKELRKLLKSVDDGEHVDPSKITVGQWIEEWLDAGAPGRRKKKVGQRTLERYGQLLRTHVKPVLGDTVLQQLRAPAIDKLYIGLDAKGEIEPRTQHHVHVVFGAMLATAHRKGMIAANPMLRVEQIPNPDPIIVEGEYDPEDDELGEGLDEAQLKEVVAGFKTSASMYAPVAVDAATGLRRNELLALRLTDLNEEKKTLRIERALEQTKKFGIRFKPPKTKRGYRTIDLDDGTFEILMKEKERLQRLQERIPDGADVDLSLVRLPAKALIFPAIPAAGEPIDFETPRNPRNFSKEFARRTEHLRETARKAGQPSFGKTRFHDLRGVHSTALLDAGIPIHRVAERLGDDPAVLLRNYMKRKRSKQADKSLSDALATLATGFLGK
jgi:integrase